MLTQAITERFCKHHSRLLAYMDALEEIVHEISKSSQPSEKLVEHKDLLLDYFRFMDEEGNQHELEEERVLHPVLKEQLDQKGPHESEIPIDRIQLEHSSGQLKVDELESHLQAILNSDSGDSAECYRFAILLLDLVWHFRTHVWAENSLIIPAAEKLLPNTDDQLWILTKTKRERKDV